MDTSAIIKFLSNKYNKQAVDTTMYSYINSWFNWYKGKVEDFHRIRWSNGLTTSTFEMLHLNMAKTVAEHWASALLNEDINIVVNSNNKKSSVFVQGSKGDGGVLASNSFSSMLSTSLELMFALGTSAFALSLDNITVTEQGEFIPNENGRIIIEKYNAMQIIPLSYRNGVIKEVSFISEFVIDNKKYYLASSHILEEDGYVIYNDIIGYNYKSTSLNINVLPVIRTKSFKPLFFILKTNIVNNVDLNSPLGVSVYSNAIDVLKACDSVYDSCYTDVHTGKRIIIFPKDMLPRLDNGEVIVPQDAKQLYMQYVGGDLPEDIPIKEFSPKLHTPDLDNEMQNQLNMLSTKCGLGTKFFNFNFSTGVTATEYVGAHNDLYRNAAKMSKTVTSAIKDLVSQILYLGYYALGANVDPNAKVVVTSSDGVVESDDKKREQDRQDVKDGLMSKVEYRMKWFGETEDEATEAIDKIQNNNSDKKETEIISKTGLDK